jgi:hypothetical protein
MIKCPNCNSPSGSPNGIELARHEILWANQYGYKIRIFCELCGQWTIETRNPNHEIKESYVARPPKDYAGNI